MARKDVDANKEPCCSPADLPAACCRVEAVISIDERGQTVLPKDLRDRASIRPGEKLAVVSMQRGGKTCCLTLIKAEELTGMVTDMLGPLMAEIAQNK